MFGSENVKVVSLNIQADPGATDKVFYLMKAPRALTVTRMHVVFEQTQNAGTASKVRLETWGGPGTAVDGTVSAYVGGTAVSAIQTAHVPAAAALTAAQQYVAADTWLVVHYAEEGAGWIAGDRIAVTLEYVDGVGA